MPKVSVIVPVYNVAPYIERCARSLFGQTLEDMEFIFVDDCSSDNSIAVLKEVMADYPHRAHQIQIRQQDKNRGPSVARNIGLHIAKGAYIAFCDSDDWVRSDMYERLYNAAIVNGSDICYCDYFMVYIDSIKTIQTICVCEKVQFLQNYIREGMTVLWNMLVNKNLYEEYRLEYPASITYCEDFWLSVRLIYFSRKMTKVDETLYYYNRMNQSSLLLNPTKRTRQDELNAILGTIDFFQKRNVLSLYERELAWRVLGSKQDMVLNPKEYHNFLAIYPQSHAYILSCPTCFCNTKIKILMWLLVHRMSLIVSGINIIRAILHR